MSAYISHKRFMSTNLDVFDTESVDNMMHKEDDMNILQALN